MVVLDGRNLSVADVVCIADGTTKVVVDPAALRRVERSWEAARVLAAGGRVYGRTTGVGANRSEDVATEDAENHGLRLLRSHAGAVGEPLPARQVRAMLAIRANQVLAGGAGLRPDVVTALAEALNNDAHPVINEHGAVGTGDIATLAQLGLALVAEHPWAGGRPPVPITLDNNDALALISSNALTLGQATLALDELRRLLLATHMVAALSLVAVDGSFEAYAEPVHAARPHSGAVASAARMRRLLGAPPLPAPPAGRIQDPYGFRCLPQIHGPALDAADELERVLAIELNAASENPLISAENRAAYHHGGFYAAQAALSLDHFRLAIVQTTRLSTARLAALSEPELTALRPYLAYGPSGSSGVGILEYAAASALAELVAFAAPASLGHAVLSRGVEELASFASLAARHALRMGDGYRIVLGCELVAATRAVRLRDLASLAVPVPDPGLPVGRAFALASDVLDADFEDRVLTADVKAATGLLERFAEL